MKPVILFFLAYSDSTDRRSKDSPIQVVMAWPLVMRRVLAIMLEQLEIPPEMSSYINGQDTPTEEQICLYRPMVTVTEHEDKGEKGGDGLEDKSLEGDGLEGLESYSGKEVEDEGFKIVERLKRRVKGLKALCGNEDKDEYELHHKKRQKIGPGSKIQSVNASPGSAMVDSHLQGQSETVLWKCPGLPLVN